MKAWRTALLVLITAGCNALPSEPSEPLIFVSVDRAAGTVTVQNRSFVEIAAGTRGWASTINSFYAACGVPAGRTVVAPRSTKTILIPDDPAGVVVFYCRTPVPDLPVSDDREMRIIVPFE